MRARRRARNFTLAVLFVVTVVAGVRFGIGDAIVRDLASIGSMPKFEDVRDGYRSSDAWVMDRDGKPLGSLRTVATERRLEWVPWNEVSPAFRETLVKVEDKRFFSHSGFDVLALASAVRAYVLNDGARGASTLTMQLADLVSKGKTRRAGFAVGRFWSKAIQIAKAVAIEMRWSKEQIAEAYTNLVSFRGELVGLAAVSHGYFEKAPIALSNEESALLIAMIRAPNAPLVDVVQRADRIVAGSAGDVAAVHALAKDRLSQPYRILRSRELVPLVAAAFVESGQGTGVIKTSLRREVQAMAMQVVRDQLRDLKGKNVGDAAALVLETATGRPVAYVSNAGPELSTASEIDGVQMRRQLGSTIKAFVYATAFDERLLDVDSLLEDSPENVAVGEGRVYNPRNYDLSFRGFVSAGEALGSSLNVPAVRALRLVGEPPVIAKMRRLGFTQLMDDDYYGPSLALGTVDGSLWELAQAYRQLSLFADDQPVFQKETKEKIFASLALPEYRRLTFGIDSALQLPFPAAVKTGTSKDMRDNWCVGFTSDYTVAVWVGNFNGDPMWNVSGMTGAAPIWRRLMLSIHRTPPHDQPPLYRPPAEKLPQPTLARIRYPAKDMLIAIDPDIPTKDQKVPVEIENRQKGYVLYLNNKKIEESKTEGFVLKPQVGKQQLELRDAKGKTIDSVDFTVR